MTELQFDLSKSFPIIETEKYLLRQFVEDDLEDVYKGLSHPDIIKYYGIEYDSLEATKEQMKWFSQIEKSGTGIWWAICSKNDGQMVGAGGLYNLSKEYRKAEIGFWLFPEYWGRGIMPQIMPLIFSYGFSELGLHRIESHVETENKKCKRALEKLDFAYEGTMRDCEIKDGKYISLEIYAVFEPD